MELSGVIGIVVGALIGHIIAASIAGGSYAFVGGSLFEVTEEPMGCLQGCLVEMVAVGIGAGAGYFIATLLAG
jgi:hypothetical protein